MPSLTDGTWPGSSPALPPRDAVAITGATAHPPSVPTPSVLPVGASAAAAVRVAYPIERGDSRRAVAPTGGSGPVVVNARDEREGRESHVAHWDVSGGGTGKAAPIPHLVFWIRRDAHAATLTTQPSPRYRIDSHQKGTPPVAMRRLLTADTYAKVAHLRDRIDDAFADGYVSPTERRDIRLAADAAADTANRAHRRSQFAAALMRCGGDDRYLSDIGSRAGVAYQDAA